jgi:hypothetical protein
LRLSSVSPDQVLPVRSSEVTFSAPPTASAAPLPHRARAHLYCYPWIPASAGITDDRKRNRLDGLGTILHQLDVLEWIRYPSEMGCCALGK